MDQLELDQLEMEQLELLLQVVVVEGIEEQMVQNRHRWTKLVAQQD